MSAPLRNQTAAQVIAYDEVGNVLVSFGTTAPTGAGYSGGALFIDTDSGILLSNSGTTASASYVTVAQAAGTVATQTITTLTSTTINVGTITNSGSTVAFTDRITTTDGVSSGTAGLVGRLLYSNTAASTAIASTSAETVFDTNYTMPANTLKAGSVLKIRYQGIGTTVVGTDTLSHKLYIGGTGGTALITSAATTMVNNHTFNGEAILICRTAGTTGTFVSTATYKVNSAEGTMTVKDDITASTSLNTQASQLITASATFNTTNANSCRMDIFVVEIY